MSKGLEKVVATQLQYYLDKNNLHEPFQSGFRPLHSTETALPRVVNDLLLASDTGVVSILVLSAAFYTACHSILLSRLSDVGITGTDLQWLSSYISGRQ